MVSYHSAFKFLSPVLGIPEPQASL